MAFVFCVPSHADDDGYYCASKGYLAFDLNGDYPKGHFLRIVRFEPKRGIYVAGEVPLQSFRVHRIACSQGSVEISGWGSIFEKYVIGISGPQGMRILDHTEDPARKFDPVKDSPDPPDFSPYGQSGEQILQLESLDTDHKYQLHLRHWEARVRDGIEHFSKAELVETDLRGNPKQHFLLYADHYLESGD